MHSTPRLMDVVALLSDAPAHGLVRGQVGTVVELLDGAYEVEFSCGISPKTLDFLGIRRVYPRRGHQASCHESSEATRRSRLRFLASASF